jgi:hypothetical protein
VLIGNDISTEELYISLGLHLLKYSIKEYLKENVFPNSVPPPLLAFAKVILQ